VTPARPAPDDFWDGYGSSRSFAALDLRFVVRSDDPELVDLVDTLYAPLATPDQDADPATLGRTRVDGREAWFVAIDGSVVDRSPARGLAFVNLVYELNQRTVERTAGVRLHASAVATGAGAIVMPGAMGAGKTTLAAGLVRAGAAYLTDEVVAFAPDGRVRTYPKPLSLGEPPASLAGLWSPSPAAARYLGATGLVPASAVGAIAPAPVPLVAVVLPQYVAGAETDITPLTAADALAAVGAHTFHLGAPGTLARLAALLDGVPVVRLSSGDLADAVRAVGAVATVAA
jgi:hypothetical protein